MKSLISIYAGCFAVLIPAGQAFAQSQQADSIVQDNIVAALAVRGDKAVLGWRFIKPTPPIDIKFSFGGRPLEDLPIQPYPGPGETTAAIALLDLGDPRRALDIERGKLAMIALGERARPFDNLWFAVYGLDGRLLKAESDDPIALVNLLLQFQPIDEPSNLTGAIVHSVRSLEATAASRRAIYILTDGHNAGTLTLDEARDVAISVGVIVNLIIFPSERAANMDALEAMANATGGQLIKREDLLAFLREPFDAVDSGGVQDRSIAGLERFFWEAGARLKAVISYGGKNLELAVDVDVPRAGVGSTASHVYTNHPLALAGSGAMILVALAGLTAVAVRRRKAGKPDAGAKPPAGTTPAPEMPLAPAAAAIVAAESEAPESQAVLAILENVADGTAFPIRSVVSNMGRATTSEVVLDDPAVSRLHAILQQQGYGSFVIENRSQNGTRVNGREIEKIELANGDRIEMGSTVLRFVQSAPPSR